jgi:hypothetical protein
MLLILLLFVAFYHNPYFIALGPNPIVLHEFFLNQVEVKSPPISIVFFVSALGAWTTHESLWVLVGFGQFEKRAHAIDIFLASSVCVHPLPVHQHHIK